MVLLGLEFFGQPGRYCGQRLRRAPPVQLTGGLFHASCTRNLFFLALQHLKVSRPRLLPTLPAKSASHRALLRSQSVPHAGAWLTAILARLPRRCRRMPRSWPCAHHGPWRGARGAAVTGHACVRSHAHRPGLVLRCQPRVASDTNRATAAMRTSTGQRFELWSDMERR